MRLFPFAKPAEELTAEDLVALRHVRESWMIEYKREIPKATSIAKSISALANTYGGWLIYGVVEKSKDDPVAGAFPGIRRSSIDEGLQRIRQSVANNMSPPCHFEIYILDGPCADIELPEECVVICIHVRESYSSPHVHHSGYIYRRVDSGSEPKPETDRYIIEKMFNKIEPINSHFRKWVERDPILSESERSTPIIRVLLTVDPYDYDDLYSRMLLGDARKIFGSNEFTVQSIPFNSVHTTSSGYICRQTLHNDPMTLSLTWIFKQNFDSEVIIPLNYAWTDDAVRMRTIYSRYSHLDILREAILKFKSSPIKLVDLSGLHKIVMGIVEKHESLLNSVSWKGNYFFKAKLLNVWRTVPYIDAPSVLRHYVDNCFPVFHEDTALIWPGTDVRSFQKIERNPNSDFIESIADQSVQIFIPIARAYGVPTDTSETTPLIDELFKAGERSF